VKIITLGPAGTYGHEATEAVLDWLFLEHSVKPDIEFVPRNIEILNSVSKTQNLGVVPIENSTEGLVSEVIKGFWLRQADNEVARPPIYVVGETKIPIRHQLLVHPSINRIEELTAVASHTQALGQCKENLDRLGLMIRKPTNSTAAAAQSVANDLAFRTTGAIASRFAGKVYGLKALQENLEDFPGNATRFHIVGPAPKRTVSENNRTALLFWVPNKPRSLLNALWSIGMEEVNMSSIHSIPLGSRGQYAFYCEFDCHTKTDVGRKIIERMRTVVDRLFILGSYPQEIDEGKEVNNAG